MSRRSSLIAFAALAAIATAVLAPAGASALNNNGPHVQGKKPLIGHDKNTWSPKKHLIGHDKITWSPKKPLIGGDPITWTPRHHHHDWRRSYEVEQVVTTTPAVQAAAAPTCNCLTKEYLPDGNLLFEDLLHQGARR